MENIEIFDAIIIGSGQAGNPLAFDLAKRGQKIALIEKNELGGSCINYGCTPTKTLIASSNLYNRIQESEELGIITEGVKLDFEQVMNRKKRIVESFRSSIEEGVKNSVNISLYKGLASFLDKHTVEVSLNDGSQIRLKADRIYINTGTKSNLVSLSGLEDVSYYDSTSIMELKHLPEHLVIVGTSYIALEFGQMFKRFGSKVTMIGRSPSIIKTEDKDVSSRVQEVLREDGIEFILSTKINKVENIDGKTKIYLEEKTNKIKSVLECTHLMMATGRSAAINDLKLENTKVEISQRGHIVVDSKLKTHEENIYALGDVKGGPQFTHISYDDYRIIINNLYGDKTRSTEDRLTPFTLFTQPQLGRVGLSERQARDQGYDILIAKFEMKNLGRAKEESRTKGFMKAIINKENHQILGAAVFTYEGGEIMAMIQIAMMAGMKYEQLRDGVFTHPSLSESLNILFDL